MPLGTIMDLDTVIQFSGNETTELLNILRDTGDSWLKFQTLAGVDVISWDYIVGPGIEVKFARTVRYYLGPAHAFEFRTSGGTVILSMNSATDLLFHSTAKPPAGSPNIDLGASPNNKFRDLYLSRDLILDRKITIYEPGLVEFSTITRTADYLNIKAEATATGVLIEDGNLSFKAADKGQIIDDGVSLILSYGALPDRTIGLNCCSGGTFYRDLMADGGIDDLAEYFTFQDGAFAHPDKQFYAIRGFLRTSGDVVEISGDKTSLTTGRLLAIFNDGSGGPAGTPVFTIDKLGKVSIGDSTGVEFGNIERTLTHYIFDTGASASLSIRINATPVIFDNGVSELALGHTTMAPKIPVVSTAQRNALTATTGMLVWHTGPPAQAQIYNGAGWVAL